jgi:hypothetical protein
MCEGRRFSAGEEWKAANDDGVERGWRARGSHYGFGNSFGIVGEGIGRPSINGIALLTAQQADAEREDESDENLQRYSGHTT